MPSPTFWNKIAGLGVAEWLVVAIVAWSAYCMLALLIDGIVKGLRENHAARGLVWLLVFGFGIWLLTRQ